jgi:hypothetical protein
MHEIEVVIINYSYIKLFNIKLDMCFMFRRESDLFFYNIKKKILRHCWYVLKKKLKTSIIDPI